jgi:predicted alpha/beta superfamily hydrolase
MRHPLLSLIAPVVVSGALAACGPGSSAESPDAGTGTPDAPGGDAGEIGCPASFAGAPCVLALHDQAVAGCDEAVVAELRAELDARATLGPLWAGGRALIRTAAPVQIAGGFNNWSTTELASRAVCGSDLVVAVGNVATGYWPYKLFDGQTWSLDPRNPAFAYDDFSGNPDGMNSILNTPDSGRGHLVELDEACSTALGNCRDVTAYLPPGYASPANGATSYPVLFMHDGQNVWDDHDCCFGHTGWELNVALDTEITAGRVAPIVVIAGGNTTARNNEYGLSPTTMATFMQFQVMELQPAALAQVRWNQQRVAVGGSSLGGLVSMHLALAYPQTYAAAASLSGAFWPNSNALAGQLPTYGKQPLAIYLDHGGNVAQNSDGAADTVEVRNILDGLGWQVSTSPSCAPTSDAICYHSEPGATHDELAWKARTWRFLRFLFPAS